MKKSLAFILLMLIGFRCIAQSLPQLGKDPLSKVIGAMTLEEKARLVVGASRGGAPSVPGSQGSPATTVTSQQQLPGGQ